MTSDIGYMASVTATSDEIGVTSCPWIIQVSAGQKIKLTLLNFDTSTPSHTEVVDPAKNDYEPYEDSESCNVFIAVEDNTDNTEVFVCDKKMRESPIYSSVSSNIIVYIKVKPGSAQPRFLIKYEGKF